MPAGNSTLEVRAAIADSHAYRDTFKKVLCDQLVTVEADNFCSTQKWLACTALYAMLLNRVSDDSLSGNFQSRNMGLVIRRTYFPEEFELLEEEGMRTHTDADGAASTAVFQVLWLKGYIVHIKNYDWAYTGLFAELLERCLRLTAAEIGPPGEAREAREARVRRDKPSFLEGLSVNYLYNGHSVSKEVYDDLRDAGVTGCDRYIVDSTDTVVDSLELLAQLIEARNA